VPGGPSNLAAPREKQHAGRVQLALICARTWHSAVWFGTVGAAPKVSMKVARTVPNRLSYLARDCETEETLT
jgi:hypothetical protein